MVLFLAVSMHIRIWKKQNKKKQRKEGLFFYYILKQRL